MDEPRISAADCLFKIKHGQLSPHHDGMDARVIQPEDVDALDSLDNKIRALELERNELLRDARIRGRLLKVSDLIK